MRHAEPVRVERASDGRADPPLTDLGRAHAKQVADWLVGEPVHHIATSPLRRARETAAPLATALGLEPEVLDGIAEFDVRDETYIPFEEIPRDHDRFRAIVEGRWSDVPGWTDPHTFQRQVVEALEGLVARFPGQTVVVFTHAGVINVFLGHILGIQRPLWFYPGYASISRVAASRSGARGVVSVNETAHLRLLSRS